MLLERHYEPGDGEIIYHYCSAETFNAICTNKRIRFCDIFTMNDFMEMHWGYQKWEEVAGDLLPEVGLDFINEIDKHIHESGGRCLPLAACFSESGDVLSQWRAYANDGKGFSIGFDASILTKLAVKPLRVLYNQDEQKREIRAFIQALHYMEDGEKNKKGAEFIEDCRMLAFDLCAFKNPSFAEEKEIRMIHLLNFEPSNDSLRLVDPGGYAFGSDKDGEKIGFFMKDSSPVAFIDIDFSNNGICDSIKNVLIGPRNTSLTSAISIYLETSGIHNVNVKKSSASYR